MIDLITGHYIISFYNGTTPMHSIRASAKNLEGAKNEAIEIRKKYCQPNIPINYTIDRRIVNSTDEK